MSLSVEAKYFLAGSLLPTLAFVMIESFKKKKSDLNDPIPFEDSDDEDDGFEPTSPTSSDPSSWGIRDAPYKMVLCVNKDLKMGKGKIAAQCGHAAVGCYKKAQKKAPSGVRAWEMTGCAKIAVSCTQNDMLEIYRKACVEKGIPCYLVEDAGRTQIAAGSRTVLGIGPAPVGEFEGLTSHLKLM